MSKNTSDNILEAQDVCFHYPDGSRGLEHCSLSIHSGSRTAVLGANGSGKTTLFLNLNGILRPQSGTILCNRTPVNYSRRGLHDLRSRIGLVFQNPDSQLFSASVREDVSFGPLNQRLSKQITKERVEEALCSVDMIDSADKPVHNLSYGQKKRVCIAGVLAMQPEILILDEPMAGLDKAMQKGLETLLCKLHADGLTIILSTHDMDLAYRWADHFFVLDQGACCKSCTATDFMDVAETLQSLGLGLPDVVPLYELLLRQGILSCTGQVPRSVGELKERLENQNP